MICACDSVAVSENEPGDIDYQARFIALYFLTPILAVLEVISVASGRLGLGAFLVAVDIVLLTAAAWLARAKAPRTYTRRRAFTAACVVLIVAHVLTLIILTPGTPPRAGLPADVAVALIVGFGELMAIFFVACVSLGGWAAYFIVGLDLLRNWPKPPPKRPRRLVEFERVG